MKENTRVYSGMHSDVIRQFEMNNKPVHPFCDKKDILREFVQYSLKMAFNDFNFRTLHKINAEEFNCIYKVWEVAKRKELHRMTPEERRDKEPSITKYLMERLGKPFEDRFISYFTGAPLAKEDFDDWHHETCKMFLDKLNGEDGNKDRFPIYKDLKYGKAQKIVNMMFKHLYCFQSEDDWETKWEPYFEHCHVTLDNFTLEWFKRNVDPYQRIDSWSNLEYREEPLDKNDYMFYQTHIRKYFQDQKKQLGSIYKRVTPFQAEFYIWPEIQLHLAAEAFVFELDPDTYKGKESSPTAKRKEIITLSVDKLIVRVTDEIQRYKKNHP